MCSRTPARVLRLCEDALTTRRADHVQRCRSASEILTTCMRQRNKSERSSLQNSGLWLWRTWCLRGCYCRRGSGCIAMPWQPWFSGYPSATKGTVNWRHYIAARSTKSWLP